MDLIQIRYYTPQMDKEQHQQFLKGLKQQQLRSQQVMDRINATLADVRGTIVGIQQTNNNIDQMKSQFGQVMDKLAQRLAGSFSNPLKRNGEADQRQHPTKIPMSQAVQAMMDHQQILFVTGAGVSAASGIPTFRGQNGMYTKNFIFQGNQIQPEQFITKQFYDKNPQPIWEWIETFHQLCSAAKPNKTHQLIHECLTALSRKGKKPVLVTQNIDNLHIDHPDRLYEYHPIHGDLFQIRCKNLHMYKYCKQNIGKLCEKCGEAMRPHVMFFDQSYGTPFGKDVKDRQFDFVVVIGSSLSTGLCIKMISQALQTIQINPGPVIEVGNVHAFENTDSALEQMLKEISNFQQI